VTHDTRPDTEIFVKLVAWRTLFALLCSPLLFVAGCGDDDACGVVSTGTVIIADPCEFTQATPHAESR
jgi:hypothetical protein